MRKTAVVGTVVFFIFSTIAFAGEDKLPAEIKFSEALLPSSAMMIGEISKRADAKMLSAHIKEPAAKSTYGFTTAVSEEKGSFKLGVLMADLKVSLKAGDSEKTSKALGAVSNELVRLGASVSLITSLVNMNNAVKAGVKLDAIRDASLPVLEPFIEEFIEKEGKMLYLRLGEWVESARLAALSGSEGKTETAAILIKDLNPAEYFLSELKGKNAPQGALDSLKALSQLRSKESIGQRDIQKTLREINNLIQLLA